MNTQIEIISTKIESPLKQEAETILNKQGLTITEAIQLLIKKIVINKTFPLELRTHNLETLQAMEAAPTKEVYHDAHELFEHIKSS